MAESYTLAQIANAATVGGKPVSIGYLARLCRDGMLRADKYGGRLRGVWVIHQRDAATWVADRLGVEEHEAQRLLEDAA